MDNLEWLEKMKKKDEINDNNWVGSYRQIKALEIIAEEPIKINESFRWLNSHSLF